MGTKVRPAFIFIFISVYFLSAGAVAALAPQAAAPYKTTIDLKNIDVLEFFKILSQKMGQNIIPSKNVSGRVNVLLNNLTYEDALDVVVTSQGLAMAKDDGIVNIMTTAEYEKVYGEKYNEKRKFRTIKLTYAKPKAVFDMLTQLKSDVGRIILDEPSATLVLIDTPERIQIMADAIYEADQPLETRTFGLKYAKPDDMKAKLATVITAGVGEVVADARTNKIIISDLADKMKRISRIVKEFDVENLQVLLDARIVEITLKDEYQRQINWQVILDQLQNISATGTFPVAASWTPAPALIAANQLLNIGSLPRNKYTVALQFLQTYGDVKVISQPSIITLNGQEAKLLVGSREAYVIQNLSQAAGSTISAENVQFIDVGVKLSVVPYINSDRFITLKIKPEVSSVREVITTTLGSRVPIVDTSEVETMVKVKDGNMLLIGGMTQLDKRSNRSGVPGLLNSKLAALFFGSRADLNKRKETLVFLMPRIVSGDVNVNAQDIAKTESYKSFPELSKTTAPLSAAIAGQMEIEGKLKGMKAVEAR